MKALKEDTDKDTYVERAREWKSVVSRSEERAQQTTWEGENDQVQSSGIDDGLG